MWRVGKLVLCVGYRLQCSVLFIPWTLNNIWIDYWTTLISRVTAMLLIFLIHKDQITPHDFWSPLISTPSWLLVPSHLYPPPALPQKATVSFTMRECLGPLSSLPPPPSSERDSVLHHEGVSWSPLISTPPPFLRKRQCPSPWGSVLVPSHLYPPPPSSESDSVLHHEGVSWSPLISTPPPP